MWVPQCLGCAVTPPRVDGGHDGVPLDELAGLDGDAMGPQCFGDLLYIGHCRLGRRRTRPLR